MKKNHPEYSGSIRNILHVQPDIEFPYTDKIYVGENIAHFNELIRADRNQLYYAPMNSGKTTGIIKAAEACGLKIIFLVPYTANVRMFSGKYRIPKVDGSITSEETKAIVANNSIILCVYESFGKVFQHIEDPKDWIIVLDEAHNLVCQGTLRHDAFREIKACWTRFNKYILLTGTTEGLIPQFKRYDPTLQVVKFNPPEPKLVAEKLHIVSYSEKGLEKLASHVLNNRVNGLTIIYIDNKEHLYTLFLKLKSMGIDEKEIQILTADEKYGEAFDYLISNEKILPGTKYLLTTSVIADGCNIDDENVEAFYSLDARDLLKLRQFHSRPRKSTKDIYDFIPGGNGKPENILDYVKLAEEIIRVNKKLADEINNTFIKYTFSDKNIIKDGQHFTEDGYLYTDDSAINVDTALITNDCLLKLYSETAKSPELRKEYFSSFSCFNDIIIETANESIDLTNETSAAKTELQTLRTTVIKAFEDHPREMITIYSKKNKKVKLDFDLDGLVMSRIDLQLKIWINKLYTKKITMELADRYVQGYAHGLHHNLIIKLLNLNKKSFRNFLNHLKTLVEIVLVESGINPELSQKDYLSFLITKRIMEHVKVHKSIHTKSFFNSLDKRLQKLYKSSYILSPKIKSVYSVEEGWINSPKKTRVLKPTGFRTINDCFSEAGLDYAILTEEEKLSISNFFLGFIDLYGLSPQRQQVLLRLVGVGCGVHAGEQVKRQDRLPTESIHFYNFLPRPNGVVAA